MEYVDFQKPVNHNILVQKFNYTMLEVTTGLS